MPGYNRRLMPSRILGGLSVVGACCAALISVQARAAQPAAASPSIATRTEGLRRIDGLVPLYWDEAHGALLMEVPRPGEDLIYQVSLAAGLGSNPVGLDRQQLGATHLVRFERVGPRVLLVALNTRYQALTGDLAEQQAVADSFARSVLWGFTVEAVDGERALVDATAFFLRDAHGVVDRLRAVRQGSYRAEPTRSAIYLPHTKGFPRNRRSSRP